MQMLVSVGTAGGGASLQIGDYDIFLKTVLSSCPACPHFFSILRPGRTTGSPIFKIYGSNDACRRKDSPFGG